MTAPKDGGMPRVDLETARMGVPEIKRAIAVRLGVSLDLTASKHRLEFLMVIYQRLKDMKVGWEETLEKDGKK